MASESTLVDTNVLVDVLGADPQWGFWSRRALESAIERGPLVINPIIYAEVSVRFDSIEGVNAQLPSDIFIREPLPYSAGFLAGKAFARYREGGGARSSPLPDFFIGAHASVNGYALLTRDAARYHTYFPRLRIIAPDR